MDTVLSIFADDVDLEEIAEPTDGFSVSYEELFPGKYEVLGALLRHANASTGYCRFATADGREAYYDRKGRSAAKVLARNPTATGLSILGFGFQPGPDGYAVFHTGIDWSLPPGAPVFAAGDGFVAQISRNLLTRAYGCTTRADMISDTNIWRGCRSPWRSECKCTKAM